MSKWFPTIVVFCIFFLRAYFALGMWMLFTALGVLAIFIRGRFAVSTIDRHLFVFAALACLSALINSVDLLSIGLFLGFFLFPTINYWGIEVFRPSDTSIRRAILFLGWSVILQVPVLIYQYHEWGGFHGRPMSSLSDTMVGTIARQGASAHTVGIIQMFSMVIAYCIFRSTRKRFYLYVAFVAFCAWMVSMTAHSIPAFLCSFIILMLFSHGLRITRIMPRIMEHAARNLVKSSQKTFSEFCVWGTQKLLDGV